MFEWFVNKRRLAAIVLAAGVIGALTATAVAQSQRFPDVAADHYAYEAVGWAAEVGVTTGYTDGTFKPQRPLSKRHAVVFMERYYDEILGADQSDDFTRGDMMVLLKAINDGTLRNTEPEPSDQTEAQPEFITEENDVSRWIKHDLIDEYGDKWPWLKEAWDYTNREDFEYTASNQNGIGYRTLSPERTGDVFAKVEVHGLTMRELTVGSPYKLNILVHELAHVYTYGHGAATNPAPIAIGWLYFESIEQNCASGELYAETAEYIDLGFSDGGSFYWRRCSHLPKTPTAEAIAVVSQAFSGEMPDWFYETFQKDDGSLVDYVKLWTAVKDSSYGVQQRMVPMLRDAFGGYCSDQIVWDTTFSFERFGQPPLAQPWRDGGC